MVENNISEPMALLKDYLHENSLDPIEAIRIIETGKTSSQNVDGSLFKIVYSDGNVTSLVHRELHFGQRIEGSPNVFSYSFDQQYSLLFPFAKTIFAKDTYQIQDPSFTDSHFLKVDNTPIRMKLLLLLITYADFRSELEKSVVFSSKDVVVSFPIKQIPSNIPDWLVGVIESPLISELTKNNSEKWRSFIPSISFLKECHFAFFPSPFGGTIAHISHNNVKIRLMKLDGSITSFENEIIEYIERNHSATRKALSNYFGCPDRTMRQKLSFLCEKGKIKRIGAPKSVNVYYVIPRLS